MKLANALILFSSCALFIGCGDTSGDNNVDAPLGEDGAIPQGCAMANNLGTIAAAQQSPAFSSGGTPQVPNALEFKAPFNQAGFETDWFAIRLFIGSQTFPTTLTPGTYDLQGQDLDYTVCGLCLSLVGDHTGDVAEEEFNTYMATSGTITVNSITPTFAATVTNATFRHIAFDANGQLVNPSGCTTSVDSLNVNANVTHLQPLQRQDVAASSLGWPGSERLAPFVDVPR